MDDQGCSKRVSWVDVHVFLYGNIIYLLYILLNVYGFVLVRFVGSCRHFKRMSGTLIPLVCLKYVQNPTNEVLIHEQVEEKLHSIDIIYL